MRSILYNLVSNAVKYSSPDRLPVIHITTEQLNDEVILTVSDNGLGMNPAYKHKLFGMFKRLHDHVEGSGIGLYIVKRIIENNGGRIEVETELDVGTTFKVHFVNNPITQLN
jgi:signal transduction histidine kinase